MLSNCQAHGCITSASGRTSRLRRTPAVNTIHGVNVNAQQPTPTAVRREREFAQREQHFVEVALDLVAEQGFMNM